MNRKIICSVLLFASFFNLFSRPSDAIKHFVSKSIFSSAGISISVEELGCGKLIAAHNSLLNLTPASTLKLLTTATALEMFGPGFCFETTAAISGKINSEGVLFGDLYILGGGDPTLGAQYSSKSQAAFFEMILSELRKKGIREIRGAIVGDESIYNTEIVPYKTPWEDMGNYYAAGVSALNYADNSYKLTFRTGRAGEKPQIVNLEPSVQGLSFQNFLVTRANDKDSAYLYGMPYCKERFIYGTVPAGRQSFSIKGDVPDPALFTVESLLVFLKNRGVTTTQEPTTSRLLQQKGTYSRPPLDVLCKIKSDSLSAIIQVTNKRSYNFYAEALMRLIASRHSTGASLSAGIAATKRYWTDRKLNAADVLIYDGSGLTPANRVNSAFLVDLLQYMATRSRFRESFLNSLAIAGVDGTLKGFLTNTPLQGKVKAKSGSFEGVLSYCGIAEKNGAKYAFCIMVNAFTCPTLDVKKAIEQFLLEL